MKFHGAHVLGLLLEPAQLAWRSGTSRGSPASARSAAGTAARRARSRPAPALVALGDRVPGDLARAEHDARAPASASMTPGSSSTSWNEPVRELVDRRAGLLHAQALLRGEHDQRRAGARECTWRRSRWKYCAAVVALTICMLSSAASVRNRSMRAELVLGALALVAVRQEQHEAVLLVPLVLGGDDVLVDDDLGAVDEVAELRLPHHERVGVGVA